MTLAEDAGGDIDARRRVAVDSSHIERRALAGAREREWIEG
ncbi:MAG: hypothetical protein ABSC63_16650 [Candidatus Binataceae bacterium]|jgi:hypothetical protein